MKLNRKTLVNILILLCVALMIMEKISIFQAIAICYIIESIDLIISAYSIWKTENKVFIFRDGIKIIAYLFIAIVTYTNFV